MCTYIYIFYCIRVVLILCGLGGIFSGDVRCCGTCQPLQKILSSCPLLVATVAKTKCQWYVCNVHTHCSSQWSDT